MLGAGGTFLLPQRRGQFFDRIPKGDRPLAWLPLVRNRKRFFLLQQFVQFADKSAEFLLVFFRLDLAA